MTPPAPHRRAREVWLGIVIGVAVLALASTAHALRAARTGGGPADNWGLPGLTTQWPVYGGNAWQDRFSPIASLSPANASRLRPAFTTPLPSQGQGQGQESGPIEVGGRIYLATPGGGVVAIDAATGALIWTRPGPGRSPTRGVAVDGNRLFVLDSNNALVALDAATGHELWTAPVYRGGAPPGAFTSTAPIVADGMVLVGVAGGDNGVRGFVEAMSAEDGRLLWRFYTVPAPGQGWVPATGSHGGGAVWTPVTVDPASGVVYVATGNPSPDFYGVHRPGSDPYTDGVVALDVHSGKLLWYGQEVPHDLWDYDAASPPVLFPLPGGGLGVGEAGKSGYWFEWNAATGHALTAPLAFVREDHTAPTPQGTLEWPGTWGGANYGPSAYDPATGLAYVAGINLPQIVRGVATPHQAGAPDFGTSMGNAPGAQATGTLTAIDVRTGRMRWQVALASPAFGGVTVTSGGLLLFGTVDGRVEALDARTGARLWSASVGANIGAPPIAYVDGGRTYVAVASGGSEMGGAPRIDQVVVWTVG